MVLARLAVVQRVRPWLPPWCASDSDLGASNPGSSALKPTGQFPDLGVCGFGGAACLGNHSCTKAVSLTCQTESVTINHLLFKTSVSLKIPVQTQLSRKTAYFL